MTPKPELSPDRHPRPAHRHDLHPLSAGSPATGSTSLLWSTDGGRTHTGKLRPPATARCVALSHRRGAGHDGPETYLVPASNVYDQLHEIAAITAEARRTAKRAEDIRWLVHLAARQRRRLGHAYLDIGEPIAPREWLALEVSHRINPATPVTPSAVVTHTEPRTPDDGR